MKLWMDCVKDDMDRKKGAFEMTNTKRLRAHTPLEIRPVDKSCKSAPFGRARAPLLKVSINKINLIFFELPKHKRVLKKNTVCCAEPKSKY